MIGKLMCGAGRSCITPAKEMIPHLKGLAGQKYCAVLDELYIRAIALSSSEKADMKNTYLMVSFELDKVPYPREYARLIFEAKGIPEENIMLFAVHTHCAPVTGHRPDEGPNDRDTFPPDMLAATQQYEKQIEEGILEACSDALESLQPCRFGWGTGESYINVNRSQTYYEEQEDGTVRETCGLGVNPEAWTDHTAFVMKFESLSHETIALFVNYAVHCCVMIGNNFDNNGSGAITSDLGGRVSRMLEEKYGGTAVWSSGAAGDVNPLMLNEYWYPDPQSGKISQIRADSAQERIRNSGYALRALELQSARHMADLVRVIRTIECKYDKAVLRTATGWSVTPGKLPGASDETYNDSADDYKIRLRLFRIGDIIFIGASGELYSSLGRKIREALPEGKAIIINHESSLISNAGYIYDDESLRRCRTGSAGEGLPGMRESRIVEGFVEPSLLKLVKNLYKEVCSQI